MNLHLFAAPLIEADGWISLNPQTKKLQALTWDSPGSLHQYTLLTTDSKGQRAETNIEISVHTEYRPATHAFSLTLNKSFNEFANTLSDQVTLYMKLQSVFGHKSVVTISSVRDGSIIVVFSVSNEATDTAPETKCPHKQINRFVDAVFDGHQMRDEFLMKLGLFKPMRVEFVPQGACAGEIDPREATIKEIIADREQTKRNSGQMVTIIVAVVIVVLVIIIIIAVVVICVRRRRNQQKGQHQATYIEKGVPAVLDEEMRPLDSSHEAQPLMYGDVGYKPTPPAYTEERGDDYQPPTPPSSEPDEHRSLERST